MQASEAADIVIVGAGGAGLAAASAAARLARRVVVLEKCARIGGTSRLANGTLMAACTRRQARAGIADSPQRHYAEIEAATQALGWSDNETLRRLFTEHAGETVDFLESIGVDLIGPLPQPPFHDRYYAALPAGRAIVHRLSRHCRRLGVEVLTGAAAQRLLVEDDRVCGVEYAMPDGTRASIAARAAVILASGDFSASRELKAEFFPGIEDIEPVNPASTGDGQRFAREIGAALVPRPDQPAGALVHARFVAPQRAGLLPSLPPWRPLTLAMKWGLKLAPALARRLILKVAMQHFAPERSFFERGAILVNREGERFTDERGAFAPDIAQQPGGDAFLVFDESIERLFSAWPNVAAPVPGVAWGYLEDIRRARPDLFHRASSVEELARRIGVPPERLAASIDSSALAMSPWIALGPLKARIALTPVGLAVNERLQVLRGTGEAIPGLFAAGNCGQGGLTNAYHGHPLCWALTSGRLAGRFAAGGA